MSIVSWFKLTEADASIGTDSSTSLNDANNTNVVSVSDSEYGSVSYFDGTAYLILPNADVPSAMFGDTSRTVSTWIKVDTGSTTSDRLIYSTGSDAAAGRRWRVTMDSSLTIDLAIFNIGAPTSTITLTENTWHHVVHTFNATSNTVRMYIDGVQDFSQTKAIVTNGSNALVIGENAEGIGAGNDPFLGKMLDFRIYDDELSAIEVGTLFSDGPEVTIKATFYTHIADVEWYTQDGASEYTLTQKEDAGSENTILSASTDLTFSAGDLTPGSTYEYNIYSDLDLVTAFGTFTGVAPVVDATSVQAILTRFSNDLTELTTYSADAVDDIEVVFRDVLTTGDVILTSIGDTTFVQDADTIEVPSSGLQVLTPFEQTAGAGQTLTVTLDSVDTELSYDESVNEVVSDSTNYQVGDYFIVDNYKVTIKDI